MIEAVGHIDRRSIDGERDIETNARLVFGLGPCLNNVLGAAAHAADAVAVGGGFQAVGGVRIDFGVHAEAIIQRPAQADISADVAAADEVADVGMENQLEGARGIEAREFDIEKSADLGQQAGEGGGIGRLRGRWRDILGQRDGQQAE